MKKITENMILKRLEAMMTAELDGELMMMNMERGNYYALDETSRLIWDLMDEPITVAEICNRLIAEYKVSYQQCLEDISPFLADLIEEGMAAVIHDDMA